MKFQFEKGIVWLLLFLPFVACSSESMHSKNEKNLAMTHSFDTVTLGAGCFWCSEAVFQQLEGVGSVISGYSGGKTKNPTYREVCSGETGHAEVVQVVYDPEKISFSQLLEIFFAMHDPTTLNQQGADIGTQYRSVIFYHTEKQHQEAQEFIAKLTKERVYSDPIVTEVKPFTVFYKAEDYHMDYYSRNGNAPYCQMVINPKVKKIKLKFSELLK